MTLQSDFTAAHNFLVTSDYKAASNETAKSRAHILCATDSSRAAVAALRDAAAELADGDPDSTEPALVAQVAALDVIFREYARMAALNTDLASVQTYMRFALKAQAQCRVTVESLERIKSSRAKFPSPPLRGRGQGEGAETKIASSDEKNPPNELLPPRPDISAPAANSQKTANELLRAQLLSGISATSFSPIPVADSPEPQKSANELLETNNDLER